LATTFFTGVGFFPTAAGVTVLAAAGALALGAATGRFLAADAVARVVLGFTAGLAAGAVLLGVRVFDAAAAGFLALLIMIAIQS
jgi:hypothetical protein